MPPKGSGAASAKKSKLAKEKEPLPTVLPRKIIVTGPQRQVFIIDDASELDSIASLQCVSLVHPKHGKPARYLHTASDLWEVQRVYQPPSSWIMHHDVQEDGSFYMCTRIDPLFLALPLLERGRKKTADHEGYFLQLDQLLSKADFPVSVGAGGKLGNGASVHDLCDLRDGWNEPVVRLSDAKVVAWLRAKVERMRHAFKAIPSLQHHYSPGERQETPEQEKARLEKQAEEAAAKAAAEATEAAAAANEEKKESPEADATTDASSAATVTPSPPATAASAAASSPSPAPPAASSSLKQSLAFLSEYLSASFFSLLLASYSLRVEDVFEKKRTAASARRDWDAGSSGKISGDIDTSRPAGLPSDSKRKADVKPVSAASKKLATAAKGTKSLMSFFGKPPPKK